MKIVLIGSGGVGKSCIALRYLKDRFVEEYDPTIEESYSTTIELDGHTVPLELVDTAGQEEFKSFRDATLDFGEAFIIVFSITDDASYKEATKLVTKVEKLFMDEDVTPILLVGNKCDLKDRRKVEEAVARGFCEQHNITYMETSAKESTNVRDAFAHIIRLLRRTNPTGNGGGGGKKKKCAIM
ncbi:hypothetical protein PTSG_02104 [Salpingoeca rosetta]|uniref:Uncharacterized protein n=1 Tax=Salpingoeca rosetta (strain ATCC 50818 / BSB-021) TaxID=946362 RepID=F2U2N0_SALR5|nr:uncharacterized protein PTSG_02104 [Salpingoeca rosetta]EGD81385.1 hypothetical protein PTSG_02104 [Salpingoeca rosetta]|eukprot:XP_004996589.1 hypothetical protein PTSG_02104 [Salpingoeca rosetta]